MQDGEREVVGITENYHWSLRMFGTLLVQCIPIPSMVVRGAGRSIAKLLSFTKLIFYFVSMNNISLIHLKWQPLITDYRVSTVRELLHLWAFLPREPIPTVAVIEHRKLGLVPPFSRFQYLHRCHYTHLDMLLVRNSSHSEECFVLDWLMKWTRVEIARKTRCRRRAQNMCHVVIGKNTHTCPLVQWLFLGHNIDHGMVEIRCKLTDWAMNPTRD
jgi:hypothetical protein